MVVAEITKLYRIQNADGRGPYRDKHVHFTLNHHNGLIHPLPKSDIGIQRDMTDDELCGFESLDKLHKWFTDKELEFMKRRGFSIVEIDGEIAAVGECQVLFKPVKNGNSRNNR